MIGQLLRRPWRLPRLVLTVPVLLGYLLRRLDRGQLKAGIARAALGDLSRADLEAWSARYVRAVVPRRLFAAALEAIAAHRSAGDHLVLLSASPDLYVPAIGAALRFDEVICTQLSWGSGHLDGHLASPNRRGEEKVRCLEALRAAHPGLAVTAYGNSPPDIAHLQRCEEAFYVNAPRTLRGKLKSMGLHAVDWV